MPIQLQVALIALFASVFGTLVTNGIVVWRAKHDLRAARQAAAASEVIDLITSWLTTLEFWVENEAGTHQEVEQFETTALRRLEKLVEDFDREDVRIDLIACGEILRHAGQISTKPGGSVKVAGIARDRALEICGAIRRHQRIPKEDRAFDLVTRRLLLLHGYVDPKLLARIEARLAAATAAKAAKPDSFPEDGSG